MITSPTKIIIGRNHIGIFRNEMDKNIAAQR